ncbi:non-ribosomal peptide synthetase [Thetidibacter halocola]|uniref:Non-ribosomal peptide synthetase n=1 Tax=Thetidibacter halocola TaxID=2827239 RepID=A0A8J7WAD3_9RHOB|nr:non-ribosomal peptide synthetase [Thetidibacter halocola]MBS0123892.1 non-ribosomal peptide synthetase [Thetidibacter halocola]
MESLERAIAAASRANGPRIALVDATTGSEVSFEQIDSNAASIDAGLERLGVGREAVVALFSGHAIASALLFPAIAAHRWVAPIPAAATAAETRALLTALRPAAIVATPEAAPLARERAGGIPCIVVTAEAGRPISLTGPLDDPLPTAQGRRLGGSGVVLTTSGTTGSPKLVALDGWRLVCGARNVSASLGLTAADIGIEIMPLHHVHGLVAGLLAPLLAGARTIVRPDPEPLAFLRTAAASGASWYTAVPTMHRAIHEAARAHPDLASNCRLRAIRSSSSALPRRLRDRLREAFDCPVVEAYGMTEASHQICAQRPDEPAPHGSLGRPAPGTLRIVDGAGMERSKGAAGRVQVRGPSVIDGYLDNPEANAATFADSWMNTGDTGRIDTDGTLTLVGRDKEIVKRGGAQVAPMEIEEALLDQPGVAEAIAFAVAHPTLGQDLAAAVVIDAAAPADTRRLRAALFDVLSAYKVPSRILRVDEIPKGPTGKPRRLDMERLLSAELKNAFSPPETPVEAVLVALFAETLGRDEFGRDDDFFLAGGDSLSGTTIVLQLNALFDVSLSAETLFRFPTPVELAAHLETIDSARITARVEALARHLPPRHGTQV